MPRSNFISDKLAGMSVSAITQDYQKNNLENKDGAEIRPLHIKTPAIAKNTNKLDEVERVKRDLVGRLNRDLGASLAQIEQIKYKLKEFEIFRDKVNSTMRDFESLGELTNENVNDFSKKIDSLRTDYFLATGRFNAFSSSNLQNNTQLSNVESKISNKEHFKRSIPYLISTILGAIIISIAILVALL